MDIHWLESVLFGFVTGFSGTTALSEEAHWGLLGYLNGNAAPGPLFLAFCHGAVLAVLLLAGHLDLGRLRWANKLRKRQSRRKSGKADRNSLGTLRLLRTVGMMSVAGTLLAAALRASAARLYILPLPLALCGILMWFSGTVPTGNRDGRHASPLDGALLGLGGLLCAIPGISLVGVTCAIAALMGMSRNYAVRIAWILVVLRMMTCLALDTMALVLAPGLSLAAVAEAALGGMMAAAGAWLGVFVMRCLIRGSGVDGFCYYHWGMALLCLVLYLTV